MEIIKKRCEIIFEQPLMFIYQYKTIFLEIIQLKMYRVQWTHVIDLLYKMYRGPMDPPGKFRVYLIKQS